MLLNTSSVILWMAASLSLLAAPLQVHAQNCGTSRRRPWRSLSCSDQDDYLDAYRQLKASGRWNELVRVHQNSGDWGHEVSMFLLWHRWYVWIFERELQRISGSCLSVPYWDWERGSSFETVLHPDTFGTNNGGGCVRDGIARNWETAENGRCLIREFDDDHRITRDVEIISRITNDRDFRDFARDLEGTPHTNLHSWVGGAMRDRWAPDDPLFLLHHSNVDRMFALWQNYHNHDRVDPDDYEREHYDDDLDEPLVIRGDRQVNLDAPGRNRPPTIRELLRNRGGIMEVQYVDDQLAEMLVDSSSRFADTINEGWNSPGQAGTRCERGSGRNDAREEDEDEEEDEDDNNRDGGERECRQRQQSCDSDSDCCSQRCREGRCRRRNNFRRAVEEANDFSFLKAPAFEDAKLEARWYELMDLYTPAQPDKVFEVLGREDCERSSAKSNTTKAWDKGGISMVHSDPHVYDCHHVFVYNETTADPQD